MTLRELRVRRLLSVHDLANAVGISPSTVSTIESHRGHASFGTIRKISAYLGVAPLDVDEFRASVQRHTS
jgi:transcriptional regulator with XRE-family HTH domain